MFGRKNHFIDVIRYEGPQDVFIWKHEAEDFNTKTQLTVHESEEAIFFRNGQALDSFPAGRYTLDTQNIPVLRRVAGLATGGVTPFHCQVYFINKAVSMGINWGTDAPIRLIDPEYNVDVYVTAFGDFSLRVEDGRKLLIKLAGSGVSRYSHDEISRYFENIMAAHVRECIASTLENEQMSVMYVDTCLTALSDKIRAKLMPVFAEYGLELNHFVVSRITHRGLEEINTAIKAGKVKKVYAFDEADITRTEIDLEEDRIRRTGKATEVQKEAFAVGRTLAANRGPEVTAAGAPFSGGNSYSVQSPAAASVEIVNAALGRNSGSPDDAEKRKIRLRELKELFDEGLITESEYAEKREEILKKI